MEFGKNRTEFGKNKTDFIGSFFVVVKLYTFNNFNQTDMLFDF